MNYVDATHIQDWVRAGRATVAPHQDCFRFHQHLLALQWVGSGIDWSLLPNVVIDLGALADEVVFEAASGLPVASHSHLLALFTPDQPGIYCEMKDGLENLDYLFWKAPGVRFVCGTDFIGGAMIPRCADFAEFRDVPVRLTVSTGEIAHHAIPH
ncbi:hypothetical protein KGA66_25930 [Actinocrinis puniceicyclus]|uniref:Uncharacterized protein n=1 Tax=Actinocrinis puniceicyclus TaxID=977794 RepID=A0A8J7WQ67_9ACTN|nr:hypothetical protein [Actinocrinis puniceicyclus]MBS2966506.1 hypothetical protein [Actinocrinis puniceicyclus]